MAGRFQHDIHVRKMAVETAQILSNCYTLEHLAQDDVPRTQKGTPRKHSYPHHPCCKWVQESLGNFEWLVYHGLALVDEYRYRTNKIHYCCEFLTWCDNNWPTMINQQQTSFLQCMDDEYKCDDPVVAYRNFYNGTKRYDKRGRDQFVWTNRNVPDWIIM